MTLGNLSLLYKELGNFETAVDYLKQSLDIKNQIGDKAGMCTSLYILGVMYAENDHIQEEGKDLV